MKLKPAPTKLSSFERTSYTLGSLSYLVGHEAAGFEHLPPFPPETSDSSLRTPDQQLAKFSTDFASPETGARNRRVAPEVAASIHTSLTQFYESSSSSESWDSDSQSMSSDTSTNSESTSSDSSDGSSSDSETAV